MRKCFFTISIFGLAFFGFGQETENIYEHILNYRRSNSDAFTKVKNEAKIAENNYKQQIVNSFVVTELGSGEMAFKFNEKGTNYALNPNVKISLPSFSNLGFSFGVPISKNYNERSLGFNFGLGLDIYSQSILRQKLNRKVAKQAKNIATNKLKYIDEIVQAELLNDSKEILNAYSEYLSKQLEQVSSDIKFKKTQVAGYPASSVTYKVAELKSKAAKQQAITNAKIFFNLVKKFFKSCGIDDTELENLTTEAFQAKMEEFFTGLCFSIPEQEIIETETLNLDASRQFNEARLNYENLLAQRKIENSSFTVSANTGFFTSNNKIKTQVEGKSKSKNFSTGLNFGFPGGSISSGVAIDLDDAKHPSLNLAFTFNPLEIYYKKLKTENQKLQTELDALAFSEETEKCETLLSDTKANAEALGIIRDSANYEVEIYQQNAKAIKNLYVDGYTSKLDNEQACLEYIQALVKYAQAKADIIIFNIQTMQSFIISEPAKINTTKTN